MLRTSISLGLVLLLPARVTRRAIAASRALGGDLRLGPRAHPHITLAMACVPAEAVPRLRRCLPSFARTVSAPEITLERTEAFESSRHVTAWYRVRRTPALSALHRACLEALQAQPQRRPTAASFARRPGERVSASSLRWVTRFAADASHDHYRPHVTLGDGHPAPDPALPLTFAARRLALCQLGPHCTCARILAGARLAR